MIESGQINFSKNYQVIRASKLDLILNRTSVLTVLKLMFAGGFMSIAILASSHYFQFHNIFLFLALRIVLFAGLIAVVLYIFIKSYFREMIDSIQMPVGSGSYNIFEISDLETVRMLAAVDENNPDIGKLYKSLFDSKRISFILNEMGLDEGFIEKLKQGFPEDGKAAFTSILANALDNVVREKSDFVSTADIFYGFLKTSATLDQALMSIELNENDLFNIIFWANSLFKKGLYPKTIIQKLGSKKAGMAEDWVSGYTLYLDRFSYDITNPGSFGNFSVEGREDTLKIMENVLSKGSKNNCILTGAEGAGKTTLVYGFAEKIYWGESLPELAHKRVVSLDVAGLLSGTSDPGEIEGRLIGVLNDAVRAGNIILFIDHIHTLFSGQEKAGTVDASEVLGQYLQGSNLRIVGVTTDANYQTYIAPKANIAGNFEKLEVTPTDEDQTIRILEDLSLYYSSKYKIRITYNGLKEVYGLAERFITNKDFPGKAVDMLENVCNAGRNAGAKTLDKKGMDGLAETILKVPVRQAGEEEKQTLLNLEEKLHSKVIGQEAAVRAVSDALRRARTQVTDNKRPIGSFLFLGPTGVGKTELSKALAWAYFGSPDNMIRMDMSEFQQVGSIERFLGRKIPGSDQLEGGDFVKKVREKPFSVVLLDEIEKAHPDILNLFLQILDEGYITDGMGSKVIFSNSIIIATSNAGANLIRQGVAKSEPMDNLKTDLLNYLQTGGIYKPEFLNRFDGTIIFKPLTKEELLQIAELMFENTTQDLKTKGYIIQIEAPALERLVEWGYQPEFGARPMRRVFQDKLESMLAKKILEESIKKGEPFTVRLMDLEEADETVENTEGTG